MAGDEYERRHMGSDGAVHRERTRSRTAFALLAGLAGILGALAVVSLAAGFSGDVQGWGGAAIMAFLAVSTAFFSIAGTVGRTVVTKSELRVNLALMDRKVPLASIEDLSIHPFEITSRAKQRADRALVFGAGEIGSRYVRVAYADGAETRVIWIASDTPDALIAAIEEGRASAGPAVRVADVETDEIEASAEKGERRNTAT
jgi:hypothetical protein